MTKQEFILQYLTYHVSDDLNNDKLILSFIDRLSSIYDMVEKKAGWVKINMTENPIPEAVIKRANAMSGVLPNTKEETVKPQRPIEVCYDNVLKSNLHSAHNKIKRLRKTIKRKAKENTKLSNDFREYMLKGCEELDLMQNKMTQAQEKANNLQWVAEHVDEAVRQQTEQKKIEIENHDILYRATCASVVAKMKSKTESAINGLRTYLDDLIEYIKSPDFDKEEACKTTKASSDYLEKVKQEILSLGKELDNM